MKHGLDVYFSADVETDGPIPGPFSILSFALVFAGLSTVCGSPLLRITIRVSTESLDQFPLTSSTKPSV